MQSGHHGIFEFGGFELAHASNVFASIIDDGGMVW